MPPGTVPPFITRFDAGSVAVGMLVFSSATRTQAEMQDFAINRVRPLFATLPGVPRRRPSAETSGPSSSCSSPTSSASTGSRPKRPLPPSVKPRS